MLFSTLRVLALSVLLSAFTVATAAAPQTLGYQGHLADSGGNPITADLSITFRLYDVASGGSALWSEVQPAVQVDGGNMAVELGKVTPLSKSIWGKQLYLGIQISGDSERAPRPPLTAAPFALRAGGTMKNTVVVSAEGTPTENGTALIAAVATAAFAASENQIVSVEMDAGTFDLGNARLDVPSFIVLSGKSQGASVITSANPVGTVLFAGHNIGKHFTAINTGQPPDDNSSAFGIGAATLALDGTIVSYVTLEDVAGDSFGSGAVGGRWGIYMCAIGRITNSLALAQNGNFGIALRASCQPSSASDALYIDGLTLLASDSVGGVRGAYLNGTGVWSNITAVVNQTQATGTGGSFGLRVLPNAFNSHGLIQNAVVDIYGTSPAGTTTISLIEGLRVDPGASVDVKGIRINIEGVKAAYISGVRLQEDNTSTQITHISDADIHIAGVQDAAQGPGGIFGIRAQGAVPEVTRTKIKVECLPNGYNFCGGVTQQPNATGSGMHAGTLVLDQVSIETGHDAPADSSAQSVAFQGLTPARIDHSTLRVLRSASDETHSGVNTGGGGADLRIHDSSIEIISASANPACAFANGAGGTIEFFGGYVEGNSCASPGSIVCAGVTKRGVGFLANSCN